jgi:hypothetical protein
MNNLTLTGFFRPVASWNTGRYLREYLTLSKAFPQVRLPGNPRESEGLCSSAGVQGAGPWPQRSAPPALARRDGESFRER